MSRGRLRLYLQLSHVDILVHVAPVAWYPWSELRL